MKFAPKSYEGFLLGYGSNSHTYRVYNNFTRKVEETIDVKFDESNGFQVEKLPIDVGDKDPFGSNPRLVYWQDSSNGGEGEYLVRPSGSFHLTTR